MKIHITILTALSMSLVCNANDMVMRNYGSYKFSSESYDVAIELKEVSSNELVPLITFIEGGNKFGAGMGGKSTMLVQAKRWAVQFKPPHQLWVYDGSKLLMLYERTSSGVKASDSNVVPELFKRAPKELKHIISVQQQKKK